jgi:arylformamidase
VGLKVNEVMSKSREESAPDFVYLSYTQTELDRAFDQTQWAPNMMALVAEWAETSRAVRDASLRMQTRRYGDGGNEDLQIFPAEKPDAPILVYIHGGEWKRRDNLGSAFPARALVPAGFTFINLNFEAIPHITIAGMLDQVRRAIIWIYRNAREFGASPDAIHVAGHSSGAHLAAVLATTPWQEFGVPCNILKGVSCISGLYDMEPVLLSMRREWVTLTQDEAAALSPVRHASRAAVPIIILYGQNESPEFRRQAMAFHDALNAAGKHSRIVEMAGQNHFEVPDALHHAESELSRIILAQKT